MLNDIKSVSNPRIKELVRLRKSPSKSEGAAFIDGMRELNVALKAGVPINEVYFCPELVKDETVIKRLEDLTKNIFRLTPDVFEKINYGEKSDGIVVVAQPKLHTLESLQVRSNSLFLIIESVEKPGNLGAILRSCDGVGVDGIIVCDQQTALFNSNVIRASLGTIFSLPVVLADSQSAFEFLKKNEFHIFVTSPAASQNYSKVDLTKKTAIVVGREDEGVSDFWLNNATQKVSIPMKGAVDSLNVSCATAVLLYEALRQRQ